jgi:hypothetical protein
VSALASLVGEDASAGLTDVVRRSSDRALRLQALEQLASRSDGAEQLDRLLGEPRLPRRVRRTAKRLLASTRKGRR